MFIDAGLFAIAALSLAGASSAHMIMKTPIPMGKDSINNSPLNKDGSDYPCKQRAGVYDLGPGKEWVNHMVAGAPEPEKLTFTGSASHGGGTCQLAVSLDTEPTKNSTFKIIQVYQGGCPTTAGGNDGSLDFDFKIPKSIPNGQSTLAWTWYNKIGNPEIYMNCAAIDVTNGAENTDLYDQLPNQYLINLPPEDCGSVQGKDVVIPYPGKNIVIQPSATHVDPIPSMASGSDYCAAAKAAQIAGVGHYEGGSATSAVEYGGNAADKSSAHATSTTLATVPAYAPSQSASQQTSTPPPTYPTLSPSSNAGVDGPAPTGGSATPPVDPSTINSADSDGSIQCDSSAHPGEYGQYAAGFGTVWRAVASGMTCVQYQQVGQDTRKRSALRHAHARRHAQHAAKHAA